MRAVRLLGGSLTAIKDAISVMINTPEMRFQSSEDRRFKVVDEVLERLAADGAEADRSDSARVNTTDGWWLLRASNTQDVLVAHVEAKDGAGLERLMGQINDQLAKSGIEPVLSPGL